MAKKKRDLNEVMEDVNRRFAEVRAQLEEIKEILIRNNVDTVEAQTKAMLTELELLKQESAAKSSVSDEGGANAEKPAKEAFCSFCGKSQNEVKKMLAGPSSFICSECIVLCMDSLIRET